MQAQPHRIDNKRDKDWKPGFMEIKRKKRRASETSVKSQTSQTSIQRPISMSERQVRREYITKSRQIDAAAAADGICDDKEDDLAGDHTLHS